MIDHEIFRLPGAKQGVLALFSYRYDAHLVPGLIDNLRPFVHGYVAFDDRKARGVFSSEPARRNALLKRAHELGASWILAADPDERFEDRLADEMPKMIADGSATAWSFNFREMFSPLAWRSDGVWGVKIVNRLFRLDAASQADADAFHGRWVSGNLTGPARKSDLNIYHLRCAHEARRKLRRDLYASQDPERKFQLIGYDYLDDERGMELQSVTAPNGYSPPFVEDKGNWAARRGRLGETVPDPVRCKLRYARVSLAHHAPSGACHAIDDVLRRHPRDDDLRDVAIRLAGQAHITSRFDRARPTGVASMPATLDALALNGKCEAAHAVQKMIEAEAPRSRLAAFSSSRLLCKSDQDFRDADAMWRRWVAGPAKIDEGPDMPKSDMAVVVIAYRAQKTVVEAVNSVIDQNVDSEIVVVNSGGGPIAELLSGVSRRLRIITVEAPLKVGAARNIGIDASRARYIAFLAADCTALTGWTERRLAAHRAGHLSVSNPVETRDNSPVAKAANRLRYWSRRPMTPENDVSHFGRSLDRMALHRVGYFPTGLHVAEDAYHNQRLDAFSKPYFARDVVTLHREPATLLGYCLDEFRRGSRRAFHAPYRSLAGSPDSFQKAASLQLKRMKKALDADRDPDATPLLEKFARYALLAERAGLFGGLAQLHLSFRLARLAIRANPRSRRLAIALMRLAAWLDPQNVERHYYLGTLLSRGGSAKDRDLAITQFRMALAVAPHHFESLGAIATILEEAGQPDTALEVIEETAVNSAITLGYVDMACEMAFRAGKYEVALAHGRKALSREPDNALFHRRLANIHIMMGNERLARMRLEMIEDLESIAARQS